MLWTIGIITYILIGVGILIWCVTTDPWGGLLIHVWWLVVFFYPFLWVWSLYQNWK